MIGINSQIQSDSGGNDGVGFAIASNTVKSVVTQLIATGKAQHALLGVGVKTATGGVAVTDVQAGSGAADGGVKTGDVVTSVDGVTVTSAQQLRRSSPRTSRATACRSKCAAAARPKTLHVTLGSRS